MLWCNCVWVCRLDAIHHRVFPAVCCTNSALIVSGPDCHGNHPDICSVVALRLSCIISLSRSYLAHKIELEWCDLHDITLRSFEERLCCDCCC